MRVHVEFYGPLRDEYADQAVDLQPGVSVEMLLRRLHVTERYMTVILDTEPVPFSAPIPEHIRTIKLVPPIGGGCL